MEEIPYQLISRVLLFAVHNKKPIRRSAFTFCENEAPSRIDFGKRRYGGPYTTEQVEDVKVLINMFKVLVCLGPVFFFDFTATVSAINHHNQPNFNASHPIKLMLLDYGMLSPLFTIIVIPVYLLIMKPITSKCQINMFKRMGLSILLLLISILLLLLYDITAYDNKDKLGSVYDLCINNSSSILNRNLVHIPTTYMLIVQHILLSISQVLLYIGAWEFICCQSPQQMKGFLFGIFFAIKGFFQFLAVVLIYIFLIAWNSHISTCHTGYYCLTLCIGLASLIFYAIVAKRYQYRKRDDICNVHLYAEEYYSKYGSTDAPNFP